ncbi:MAG: uridine kinase [Planctomycetes bacterium]|nr:uridine kinase [Planctomycetota bacterium]
MNRERGPRLVAIAGGTASGKTTLAQRLAEALGSEGVAVLPQDAYYRPLDQVPGRNFDHPAAFDLDLLAAHAAALRAGRPVDRPVYDYAVHDRAERTVRLGPAGTIVLEGLLALHDPRVRALADLALYVEAPPDLRLARRVARDMTERGRTAESVLRQWTEQVRPMHAAHVEPQRDHAHLLVRGDRDPAIAVAVFAAWLRPPPAQPEFP